LTVAEHRGYRRRYAIVTLAVVLAVGVEMFARLYLGLGDPPLSQPHPTIEYLFKPNQDVLRFHQHFRTNRYGMRSDDFPPEKTAPNELRVMVYGDSVINGGSVTDQSRVATDILQHALSKALARPVVVGNVSAGSWGPPNQLAYINQYGFLDADIAIFVLSSHDYSDAPTFEPLDPDTHPTTKPLSATTEAMTRYLPRYLHWGAIGHDEAAPPDPSLDVNPQDVQVSLGAIRQFLAAAKASRINAYVVQHLTQTELESGKPYRGHDEIFRVASAAGVRIYQDLESLKLSIAAGRQPYRDNIHLNDEGQRVLADLLNRVVHDSLAAQP
jgi:lysophospholipase L1-like esterase